MKPHLGGYNSLSFLSATASFGHLTQRPLRAIFLTSCVAFVAIWRYKDVRCVALGTEVQGHLQEQLTQSLNIC